MQLLWIGCLESDEEFKNKSEKGYNLASAQVSQKNVMYGIEEVAEEVFDSINGSVAPHFPVYKDKYIERVEWTHSEGAKDISVGFYNRKYINRYTCKREMEKTAENWVQERYLGSELIVFIYSMRSAPMAAACCIKRKIPNAKLFLIVTDLPEYMDLSQSKIKSLLKQFDGIKIANMRESISGYILYAEKMAEYLEIPDGQWLLMEGLLDENESQLTNKRVEKRAIMYSGNTELKYGLDLLLQAFMQIEDKNVELWITGGGSGDGYIRLCAEKDERIKFFGFLPSRTDVLEKQRKASFLINMRLPTEAASSYCFPSKLLEYMASGTPVLSFKLGGIPQEYDPYLIYMHEVSVKSIKKTLITCIEMDNEEALNIGKRSMDFVLKNKTISSQCKRIYDFACKE